MIRKIKGSSAGRRISSPGGGRSLTAVMLLVGALVGCSTAPADSGQRNGIARVSGNSPQAPGEVKRLSYTEEIIPDGQNTGPAPRRSAEPRRTTIEIYTRVHAEQIGDIYSLRRDTGTGRVLTEALWQSSSGASETRDWESCEKETSRGSGAHNTLNDLLTDILGPREHASDAVRTPDGRIRWEYSADAARIRVTTIGPTWFDRYLEIGTEDRFSYRIAGFALTTVAALPNWRPGWLLCERD